MRLCAACLVGCTAAGLVGLACTVEASRDGAPVFETVSTVRALTTEQRLAADIHFSAGEFRLRPDSGASLYRTEIEYDASRFDAEVDYEGGQLDIRVSPDNVRGDVKWEDGDMQRMRLALSPRVPLVLDMVLGAVEADLELGGLALERLELRNGASQTRVGFATPNTITCEHLDLTVGAADFTVEGLGNARCRLLELKGGVGAMTLDFGGAWPDGAETRAEMKLGIGSVEIRVPRGLGVRVHMNRVIAGFSAPEFTKRGNDYYSPGYDDAAARLFLDVTAAFGDISIRWIEDAGSEAGER